VDGFPVHAAIVCSKIIRKKAQLVPITAWTAEPSTLLLAATILLRLL
jgi:hypothetical protein